MGFWSWVKGAFAAPQNDGSEARPTQQQAYVDLCLAVIRSHPDVKSATAGDGSDLPVAISMRDGTEQQMFLRNTFAETRELSPEARATRVSQVLGALLNPPPDPEWAEARDLLVPVVRLTSFGGFAIDMVKRPFLPFVHVFLVLDRGATMAYLTQKTLDEWGQPVDDVFGESLANLDAHVQAATTELPDVQVYDHDAPYPIWHVTRDDSYETSRLALPGFLASFRGKVNGTPIAIAPHRSLLVIAGDADPAAIQRLAQMALSEFRASPRGVSPGVYTVNERDAVVPLAVAPTHPHCQLLRRGHRMLASQCYGDQQPYLEKRFEDDLVDLFVAKLSVVETKQGEVMSYAVLSQGVATLLPQADNIALSVSDDSGPTFLVAWATFFELAAHCLERAPEFDPPRFRSVAWPDAETMAALRGRRVN